MLRRFLCIVALLLLGGYIYAVLFTEDCPSFDDYSATIEVTPEEVTVGDQVTVTATFTPDRPIIWRLSATPEQNFSLASFHNIEGEVYRWVLSDIAGRSTERVRIGPSEPLILSVAGDVRRGLDEDAFVIDFRKHGRIEAKRGDQVRLGGTIYHGGHCGIIASESQSVNFEDAFIVLR